MDFVILYYLLREIFCPTDHTDEHGFLSYSIICEICEICVRNILVTQMSQITQILYD